MDNEMITHIYGCNNLFNWVRYWYIDSFNRQAVMLIDKTYVDYDYDGKGTGKKKAAKSKYSDADLVKNNQEAARKMMRKLAKAGRLSEDELADLVREEYRLKQTKDGR